MADNNSNANETQRVTYTLPTSVDTSVFGPAYWGAFHDLASRIPCIACREKMQSMMTFVHDYVNYRLGKQIYDKQNFINTLNEISKLKKQTLILK